MPARYLTALIFCGARSSAILTSAAFLMAGTSDFKLLGSAIAFIGGLRSRPGRLPRALRLSRKPRYAWGMPRKLHSVAGGGGGGGSCAKAGGASHASTTKKI